MILKIHKDENTLLIDQERRILITKNDRPPPYNGRGLLSFHSKSVANIILEYKTGDLANYFQVLKNRDEYPQYLIDSIFNAFGFKLKCSAGPSEKYFFESKEDELLFNLMKG
jgi:hypothetical protein